MMLMYGLANAQTFTGTFATDYPTESAELTGLSGAVSGLNTDMIQAKSDITALDGRVGTLETDNTQNKADIAQNKTDIAKNAGDITALDTRVTTAEGNINTNTTDIATNKADILTNKNDIAALDGRVGTLETDNTQNKADIATNKANITQNTTDIAKNAGAIATNKADIATNRTDINKNAIDIGVNQGAIATNKADIATNKNDIKQNAIDIGINKGAIATNAVDIATNKADIAQNKADIATNTTDIATLQSQMGSAVFAGGKGTGVKAATNVTDAILAIDQDFYRAADGKIHIGKDSFVLDDTNGDMSFYDSVGAEKAVNFTKTPTVNGVDVATVNETNRLHNRVDNLKDETRTGMASVAALTALQPLGMDSGRLQFQLGTGFYKGEAALAAGANFYATENVAFNAGVAADTSFDNNVVKAGVSVGFLKPKKQYTVNANQVTINAAKHTSVQAKEGEVYITPAQLKALLDRIEALEKQVAKQK